LPPEHLVDDLVGLLDDISEIDDPADLELLAGTLLIPISMPEVPDAARRVVIDAIEARADPIASATLAALAVLAPSGLGAYAHEAAVRLDELGLAPPSVADIGTLGVDAAAVGVDADAEIFVAVLARPNSRARQVLVFVIDAGTDALVECVLTPPLTRREAERLLRDPLQDSSGLKMLPFATAHLRARVAAGVDRSRDLGIALGSDAAPTLRIIARALTGDSDGIVWPETLAPWEENDDERSDQVEALPELEQAGEMLGEHPAAKRPGGDASGRRRAKRKAERSARKQGRRR
jgi:hypothetical protein